MRKDTIEQNPLRPIPDVQRHLVLVKEPAVRPTDELLYELQMYQLELQMQNEELRRAHAALEESRDRYAELYDFAPVGYLTLSNKGLITEINSTAAGLFGLERKKLLNRYFAAFVTVDDGDRWHLFFSDVMKHTQRQNAGLKLKRNDGAAFSVRLDCHHVITAEKESVLYISLTDITENKHPEAILHEVETHTLSMALACAEMGSWDWDIGTGCVIFNQRWAKMRGYRLQDLEPHVDTWENGIHPDDFPAFHAALTAHLENRTPFFQAEYRVRTLAGPLIWLLTRGTVIRRDAQGNPLRIAGIDMDITERKRNDAK